MYLHFSYNTVIRLTRIIDLPPSLFLLTFLGHIYAGGALLGLCHDYIIMNDQKGFFCFPEVNWFHGVYSGQ